MVPPGPHNVALGVAVAVAVVASATDIRRGVVPNGLTLAAALAGLGLAALAGDPGSHLEASAGVVAVLLGVRGVGHVVAGQPGLGMGDVKLGGALGLLVGWPALWAFYLAAVLGAAVGVAGLASGRLARRQRVPFAPFVAAGVGLALWVVPFGAVWGWAAG